MTTKSSTEEKSPFKYKFGQRVRCQITGFEGVVYSRSQFFNGCVRYAVRPTVLKDGIPQDSQHFDEEELALVPDAPVTDIERREKPPGGDRPPVPRQADIRR